MTPLSLRRRFSDQWPTLTIYQRFESLIALVLTILVTLVIVVALYRLSVEIVSGLLFGALDPFDHRVFQSVFGHIMTVLIALEFNHTLRFVVTREQSLIQVRTILLIALLAMARRFIVLDFTGATSIEMFGLAAVTLALGGTYWLMRARDEREGVSAAGRDV